MWDSHLFSCENLSCVVLHLNQCTFKNDKIRHKRLKYKIKIGLVLISLITWAPFDFFALFAAVSSIFHHNIKTAPVSCVVVQNGTKYLPQTLFSANVPTPVSASAHWPLPLLEQLWPACSSDPHCYCQTASQWKIPPHFLGFTNTVWNKKPLSACVLFTVLIGGKINALCISTRLLKQDKNCMNRSQPVAIEWIV